jgi:hypothetical protein
VRHFHLARRAGVPAVAAVLGVLVAAPAFADVSVSPTTSIQGSGDNLTFHVTNTGTAPIGTVTLELPDDTAVAEAYPLSVDDWAPKIEQKTLATPLATIHGGTPVSEATKAIIWLAMPGHQLAPGKSADLSVALGPLPTLSKMSFTVVTKYADGSPGPIMPPVSIALTPDPTGQLAVQHNHNTLTQGSGTSGASSSDAENTAFAAAVADATRGPSFWSIGGWVIAGLVLLGGAFVYLRGRHRAEDEEPEEDEADGDHEPEATTKEPVAAGTGKWSFKG